MVGKLGHNETLKLPNVKPIVLFVGPHNVGKTAVLASLIGYSKDATAEGGPRRHQHEWVVMDNIVDSPDTSYQNKAKELISELGDNKVFVGSTNDYFVFSVHHRHRPAFIALEAPGEHYYDKNKKELFWPLYLRSIVNRVQRKVYLFIFSDDLLSGDRNDREAYDTQVASFISNKLKRGRDKFCLVYTKVNTDPALKGRLTPSEIAKRAFSKDGIFPRTGEQFQSSPIKDRRIIAYTGGTFGKNDQTGNEDWAPPPAEYPGALMEAILTMVRGRPWWKFW